MDTDPTSAGPFLIEILEGQAPDGKSVHTLITNVYVVPYGLQNELQLIIDCARMQQAGLQFLTQVPDKLLGATANIDPAQNRRLALPELRVEAEARVMLSAFRDAVELVGDPLESARRILDVWKAKKIHEAEGEVTIDPGKDAGRFDALPFNAKLDYLEKQYGFQAPSEIRSIVPLLVRARNCVVHRNGTVAARDCDENGRLQLKWQATEFLLAKSAEEYKAGRFERMKLPFVAPEGHVVAVRRTVTTREYKEGEKIRLSPQDLNEVCATLMAYALIVKEAVQQFGVEHGVPMSMAATADSPNND